MTDKELKQLKGAQMEKKGTSEKKPIYFDTGHLLLSLVTGAGEKAGYGNGYPAGTICRDHGDSGSSKSFKATELIAANYHKYKDKFKWRYCDPEHGNTIDTVSLYGFDLFKNQEDFGREVVTVEDWDYDLNKWLDSLKPDECGIYVLDSLDSISSVDTEERKDKRRTAYDKDKEFDSGTYSMSMQKFLSQEFFRGLTAKLEEKNALLYIISQERDNVGAGLYGAKNRTSGGRALQFYETVRIVSKVKQKEEQKGRAVSVVIETTAEKVRHPRPFRKCFVTIHFTYGMDSVSDEIDFLYDLRTADKGELKKSANSIEWEDLAPMDKETLIQYIHENKLVKVLHQKVIDKWNGIEDSIAIKRPAKFAEDD